MTITNIQELTSSNTTNATFAITLPLGHNPLHTTYTRARAYARPASEPSRQVGKLAHTSTTQNKSDAKIKSLVSRTKDKTPDKIKIQKIADQKPGPEILPKHPVHQSLHTQIPISQDVPSLLSVSHLGIDYRLRQVLVVRLEQLVNAILHTVVPVT